jgi:hypothetical protein
LAKTAKNRTEKLPFFDGPRRGKNGPKNGACILRGDFAILEMHLLQDSPHALTIVAAWGLFLFLDYRNLKSILCLEMLGLPLEHCGALIAALRILYNGPI